MIKKIVGNICSQSLLYEMTQKHNARKCQIMKCLYAILWLPMYVFIIAHICIIFIWKHIYYKQIYLKDVMWETE